MRHLLLLCSLLAAPFEDTQRRFHLELPVGWTFAPQPGDTGGATFRRQVDGALANAMVRVMPFSGPVTLSALAGRVAAAAEGEPGFHLLLRQEGTLGGTPSVRRRYIALVNGDPKMPKMVEQQVVLVGNTGFVVHAEALADSFPAFEQEILALIASFRPGAAPGEGAPAARLRRRDVVGRWQGGGHTLVLSQAGAITIDGHHGTYRLEAGSLVAQLPEGTRIYRLDGDAHGLTLGGAELGEGVALRRVRAAGARGQAPRALQHEGAVHRSRPSRPPPPAAAGGGTAL